MYDFELINQELSESRLFRYTSSFGNLTGRTIADLLYLNTLMLMMFVQDKEQRDYAVAVARKTVQYGPFAVFRTTSTDLYMLAFAVNHPDYKSLNIKNKEESFLKSLNFQNRRYYNFLKKMSTVEPSRSEASAFFIRLENQLSIKNSLYKQLRRLILDWKDLKYSQKQLVVSKLLQQLRIKGRGSENFEHLVAMKRERKYSDAPKSDRSVAKTVAGTAAGAYVGSKVIPKLTRNKLSSRTGAGIGAIAGYWASGRRKKV
tara:strand:- start:5956 stop:6732 length:777 start_codon:yes stop_codon:yes gene_type:complete